MYKRLFKGCNAHVCTHARTHTHTYTHVHLFIHEIEPMTDQCNNCIKDKHSFMTKKPTPALVRIREIYNHETLYTMPRQPYKSEKHGLYSSAAEFPCTAFAVSVDLGRGFQESFKFLFSWICDSFFLLCLVSLSITS